MEIQLEGVEVGLEKGTLTIKGPKGELSREFRHPNMKVGVSGGKVTISPASDNKKLKALAGTWRAHLNNMATGVKQEWKCSMRATYSHFPMKMELQGNELTIKNFLGSRGIRTAKIVEGVRAEVKGSDITLMGIDKEKVGQSAANIEQSAKVSGFDRRVFQDGIWKVSGCLPAEEEKDEGKAEVGAQA